MTRMHAAELQFWDGQVVLSRVVLVVTRLAPWLMRHSRFAARQFARQPAEAMPGIASTTATPAATHQGVIGEQAS